MNIYQRAFRVVVCLGGNLKACLPVPFLNILFHLKAIGDLLVTLTEDFLSAQHAALIVSIHQKWVLKSTVRYLGKRTYLISLCSLDTNNTNTTHEASNLLLSLRHSLWPY